MIRRQMTYGITRAPGAIKDVTGSIPCYLPPARVSVVESAPSAERRRRLMKTRFQLCVIALAAIATGMMGSAQAPQAPAPGRGQAPAVQQPAGRQGGGRAGGQAGRGGGRGAQ